MANENNKILATTDDSQIVLYQPDESISLQVKIEEDTVWLTQAQRYSLSSMGKQCFEGISSSWICSTSANASNGATY